MLAAKVWLATESSHFKRNDEAFKDGMNNSFIGNMDVGGVCNEAY